MDAKRFDQLTRGLSAVGSRRGFLRLPGALPLVGALAALISDAASGAKRRKAHQAKGHGGGQVSASNHKHKGRRRKHNLPHHHRHHHKKKKKHDPTCIPESMAETCASQCGTVLNNCNKPVDCGSCSCDPPCAVCKTCDAESITCIADPATVGEACGACRICDAAGECVSDANGTACEDGNACTTGETCQGGVCGGGTPVACPADECQDPGVCNPTTGDCSPPTNKANGVPCAAGVCCAGECEACCADVDCPGCQICAADKTCDPLVCGNFETCSGGAHTCTCVVGGCSATACLGQQVCVDECCCKLNNQLCDADDECCSGSCIPGTDGNVCTLSGCGQPCVINENCNLAPCFACVGGQCQG